MANTTWITLIRNESNLDIFWEDGEDLSRRGTIKRKKGDVPQKEPFDNTGFCFPWVDHTKDELSKAIRFSDASNGKLLFVIFQSYNKDTIQWLKDPSTQFANNAMDVPGPAGTGGKKAIVIPLDPNVPYLEPFTSHYFVRIKNPVTMNRDGIFLILNKTDLSTCTPRL